MWEGVRIMLVSVYKSNKFSHSHTEKNFPWYDGKCSGHLRNGCPCVSFVSYYYFYWYHNKKKLKAVSGMLQTKEMRTFPSLSNKPTVSADDGKATLNQLWKMSSTVTSFVDRQLCLFPAHWLIFYLLKTVWLFCSDCAYTGVAHIDDRGLKVMWKCNQHAK